MFGLGAGEIVVILVVALLVLGPTQLPNAAKEIGKAIRTLRKHTRDLQETIDKDETIGGTMRELKSALRGDELFAREPLLPSRPAQPLENIMAHAPPAPPGDGSGEPEPEPATPAQPAADASKPAEPPKPAETARDG